MWEVNDRMGDGLIEVLRIGCLKMVLIVFYDQITSF